MISFTTDDNANLLLQTRNARHAGLAFVLPSDISCIAAN